MARAIQRDAIVGTAGHIDHGKTALIQRLTGTNTDRLPEEQKRGISIELGFAFLDLPSGRRVGIVDVPGHERFVRQMLAGAGGMDLVLLVIAADEGVMPQTREHLEIVSLLGVPDGLVVLTKCDLVDDPEWLEVVTADIQDVVRSTPFEGKPIVRCSARTGQGIEELVKRIEESLAAGAFIARGRETRLPIDRVFVLQGFGTVVTGTLWNGILSVGDAVTLLPQGTETRIKSVQVHDREVGSAGPGQRVAVSLHRVDKQSVSRGDWLVRSDVLRPSHMMDARFRLSPGAAKSLENRDRVRVHLGASEVLARVLLLDRDTLEPGEQAPVQLRFENPAVAEAGDRFVVRSYSPMRTIGGGAILQPLAAKRRRLAAGVEQDFKKLEEGSPLDRLVDLVEASGDRGEAPMALRTALGLSEGAFDDLIGEARRAGRVAGEGRLFSAGTLARNVASLREALAAHHREHPLQWGIGIGELKARASRAANPALFDLARQRLVEDGLAVERGEQLAAAGRSSELPEEARAFQAKLEKRLDAEGFAPSNIDYVLRELAIPGGQDLVTRLLFEGRLVAVTAQLVYPEGRIREVVERLRAHFEGHAELSVGDAKGLFDGISRKHVVPLLEHADRRGWTRRVGEGRVRGGAL